MEEFKCKCVFYEFYFYRKNTFYFRNPHNKKGIIKLEVDEYKSKEMKQNLKRGKIYQIEYD